MSALLRHISRTHSACLRTRPPQPASSGIVVAALPQPVPCLPSPCCAVSRRRFSASAPAFSGAAASTSAIQAPASTSSSPTAPSAPITDGRVPPPTLLYARPAGAPAADGGTAAAASCSLQSRAHLATLDASTRSRLFELTFLGTASGRASLSRNVSSVALRMGRTARLSLFDCGEGTSRQLQRCSHLQLGALQHVFITHMHGDHVLGLCSVLAAVDKIKRPSAALAARPLHIFGPLGIAAFVKTNLAATHTWISRPLVFHELLRNDTRAVSSHSDRNAIRSWLLARSHSSHVGLYSFLLTFLLLFSSRVARWRAGVSSLATRRGVPPEPGCDPAQHANVSLFASWHAPRSQPWHRHRDGGGRRPSGVGGVRGMRRTR